MLDRRNFFRVSALGGAASLRNTALTAGALPGADEHEAWRKDRLARLTKDDGWLTLAGLHWLEPGDNRIPSAPGLVFRRGLKVAFESREPVALNGKPSRGAKALEPDTDKIVIGTHTYFVIVRGDRVAIRERDTQSAARLGFRGLDLFPFNPAFRLEAKWLPYAKPVRRRIVNVANTVDEYDAPGLAEFQLAGRTLRLEPVIEEDHLFYVFKDTTAGKTTYPAGRFIELPMPKDGRAIVDFNRAYNPPCAFTSFATCPLPLKQNHLPIAIEAGERAYHHPG